MPPRGEEGRIGEWILSNTAGKNFDPEENAWKGLINLKVKEQGLDKWKSEINIKPTLEMYNGKSQPKKILSFNYNWGQFVAYV